MTNKKEKYYMITNYYGNSRVRTFSKREEWEAAIDTEAFDGGKGCGDSFVVGYITDNNFEIISDSARIKTFKKNKVGGYYYDTVSSLYVHKNCVRGTEEDEDCEYELLRIEDFEEKEEQNVSYIEIIKHSEIINESGEEKIKYIDEYGDEYEDEEDIIEENKPSQYLII